MLFKQPTTQFAAGHMPQQKTHNASAKGNRAHTSESNESAVDPY